MREWLESPVDDRTMNFHCDPGRKLALVGVSAEPVIEYAAMLRAIFPGKTLVPVGYMDGICGYLPTTAMLAEGGMEVSSPGYSLGTAHYRDTITEDITGAVRSLAEAEQSPDESQREQH